MPIRGGSHAVKTLLEGMSFPMMPPPFSDGLAVDSSLVYINVFNGLIAVPKDGGAPQTLVRGAHETSNVMLSATKAYFFDDDNALANTELVAYDFASKSVSTLAHWSKTLAIDGTIDDQFAYVTTHKATGGDAIHRVALDGSKDEVWVASDSLNDVYGWIRNDARAVYWTVGDNPTATVRVKCK